MSGNTRLLTAAGMAVIVLAAVVGLFATGILPLEVMPWMSSRPRVLAHDQHVGRRPPDRDWAVAVEGSWTPLLHNFGVVSDFREMALSVAFPVRVVATHVELGQHVSKGEQLARVEAPQLRERITRLDTASSRITLATAERKRLQGLEEQGLATAPKIVTAEVALLQAQRDGENAWQQLRQALVSLGQDPQRQTLIEELKPGSIAAVVRQLSVVLAPFDGVVVHRGAMPGVTLKAGAILFAIEDVSHAYVDVGIVPDSVSQWKRGAAAVSLLGQPIALQPTETVARLDPATGLMVVRYRCDLPADVQVDGARLAVTLQAAERSVTWVPASAVVSREGKTWCLLADENGSPTPARVQTGTAEEDRIPILEGVAAGQRVLAKNAYEYLYRDLNELLQFED